MEDLVSAVGRSRSQGFGAWEQQHQRFRLLLLAHAGEYVSDEGGGWAQGAREHADLARLCRERDAEGAARLLARHLSRAALTLIASMDPLHDLALLRAAVRQVTAAGEHRG